MLGKGLPVEDSESSTEDYSMSELRGLQPRCIEYLFWKCQKDQDQISEQKKVEYLINCSYIEIYNENIFDLLDDEDSSMLNGKRRKLNIREDLKNGVYIEGVKEEAVGSLKESMDLLIRGARNRHIGSTSMNIESSRSHSVFTLHVEAKIEENGIHKIRHSKFHFVDLAGSERQK